MAKRAGGVLGGPRAASFKLREFGMELETRSQDDFEASLRCSAADGALQGLAGVFGRLPYGRSSKTWGRGIRLDGSRRETLTRPPSAPGRPLGGFGSVLVDDAEELVRPIRLKGAVKVHP